MPATLVGTPTTYAPITLAATRTVTVPAGISNGDLIMVFATKSGSASGFTVDATSTLSGLTELASDSRSGIYSSVYIKANASASDVGKTIVLATAGSYRSSVHVAVYSGVPTASPIDAYASLDANGSVHKIPTVTAVSGGTLVAYIGGTTGAVGSQTWETPSGFTQDASSSDPATSGGASSALYHQTAQVAASAVVPEISITPSVGATTYVGWAIVLKGASAVTDTKPGAVKSNAGSYVAVGAANTVIATGDASDATYAESGANPTGASIEWSTADPLVPGQVTVTVRSRYVSGGSGSQTVRLKQGATVIASWTSPLTAAFANYVYTTTASQAANITDWTAGGLSVEVLGTAA